MCARRSGPSRVRMKTEQMLQVGGAGARRVRGIGRHLGCTGALPNKRAVPQEGCERRFLGLAMLGQRKAIDALNRTVSIAFGSCSFYSGARVNRSASTLADVSHEEIRRAAAAAKAARLHLDERWSKT